MTISEQNYEKQYNYNCKILSYKVKYKLLYSSSQNNSVPKNFCHWLKLMNIKTMKYFQ